MNNNNNVMAYIHLAKEKKYYKGKKQCQNIIILTDGKWFYIWFASRYSTLFWFNINTSWMEVKYCPKHGAI